MALRRRASQLDELGGIHRLAAHQFHVHPEQLHLSRHRPGLSIIAAKENRLRITGLDRGQKRIKVDGLVVSVFVPDYLTAGGLHRCLERIGQTLAVGGGIVDHRKSFQLKCLHGILAERLPLLVVVSHQSESRLEALVCVFDVSRH